MKDAEQPEKPMLLSEQLQASMECGSNLNQRSNYDDDNRCGEKRNDRDDKRGRRFFLNPDRNRNCNKDRKRPNR